MTEMIETGTYRSIPRKLSQLTDFVTPEPDLFVLAHLGIPSLTRGDCSLSVHDRVVERHETIRILIDPAFRRGDRTAGMTVPYIPGDQMNESGALVNRALASRLAAKEALNAADPQVGDIFGRRRDPAALRR